MNEHQAGRLLKGTGRRLALGHYGEELACRLLGERGYVVVERNWRCSTGEVDIVAREGDCWVFVEVKTRRGHAAGWAEDGMTAEKAARLTDLAQTWLGEHALDGVDWRIDLVAIELDARGQLERLNIVPAVTADRVG
jgi:putative endonuclease